MLTSNKKKLTKLATALALMSTASFGAMAEWTLISDSIEFKNYVDLDTIRRSGHMAKIWSIKNYQSPQEYSSNTTYLSTRLHYEYDCRDERKRLLDFSVHSKKMASGAVLGIDSNVDKWSSVAPRTIAEEVFKIACGIK